MKKAAFGRPCFIFSCIFICMAGVSSARQYAEKLNDPEAVQGSIGEFKVSPDGKYAVYRAILNSYGTYDLYSRPVDLSGPQIKLNPVLQSRSDVYDFEISEDSQYVIYNAAQDNYGMIELYSVKIGGGKPVKLNGWMPPGRDVRYFKLSNFGQRVAFLAADFDGKQNIYSSFVDGGGLVRLNGDLKEDTEVDDEFYITADGEHVVYFAQEFDDDSKSLYSAQLNGGGRDQIAAGFPRNSHFKISPDNTTVAYVLNNELFAAPVLGGSEIKINPQLNEEHHVSGFSFSANSVWMVYTIGFL